jgi:plastocyanin
MGPPTEIRYQPTRPRILAVLAVLVIALAGVVSRPAHAAAKANLTVKNYSFSEPDLVIDPGTEVTWTATQGDHTVTSNGGSFDAMIAQDYNPHSFSYTFTNPGRYTYYCGFHRAKGMEAVVEVRDPSGGPTTTEPPTTTTWPAPTTTTSAPAVEAPATPDAQAVAAPAPAVRQGAETASDPMVAGDGSGPALVLLLSAGGLLALAGAGAAVWRWRRH